MNKQILASLHLTIFLNTSSIFSTYLTAFRELFKLSPSFFSCKIHIILLGKCFNELFKLFLVHLGKHLFHMLHIVLALHLRQEASELLHSIYLLGLLSLDLGIDLSKVVIIGVEIFALGAHLSSIVGTRARVRRGGRAAA